MAVVHIYPSARRRLWRLFSFPTTVDLRGVVPVTQLQLCISLLKWHREELWVKNIFRYRKFEISPSSCVKIIRIYWLIWVDLIWVDLIGFSDSVVTQTGRVLPSIGTCVLLRTLYNYFNCKILLESPQSSTDLLRPYTVYEDDRSHI